MVLKATQSHKEPITTVECFEDGLRLDVFLAASIPELTRSAAQKLIDTERVTCNSAKYNNAPMQKSHRTSIGETYEVIQDEPESPVALPQEIPLVVVFEDSDLIVVNKPKGMVVHPAPGHPDGTLVNALLAHCGGSLSGIGGVRRPGIVHRLDKDTSGLVIAAKNDKAHNILATELKMRTLRREYNAIVNGRVKNNTGTIDAPIGRSPADRKRQAVTGKNSRPAVTHYEVLAHYINPYRREDFYTHVKCRLETGRTHQIRVHMAYLGHPILGDIVYGHKKPELGMSSQCLHASALRFIHPSTGEEISLEAPLPEYFIEVLNKLKPV